MDKPTLKPRMMGDEMAEVFAFAHPELFPTKSAVGRYARRIGYKLHKQKLNGKQTYFYINVNGKAKNN